MHKYFFMEEKQRLIKKISIISGLLLIIQMIFGGFFFVGVNSAKAISVQNMCSSDIDVVLVLDRSGSMDNEQRDSRCEWEELEWVTSSYQCVAHIEGHLTEAECLSIKDSADFPTYCAMPIFTPGHLSKFDAAKKAANDFLDKLGTNDQSALVSFSNTAMFNQSLTNIHTATQAQVSILTILEATNIGDAIGLANTELSSTNANPQADKAIILLTDGKPNQPYPDEADDVQLVEDMAAVSASAGFKIYTIGLGNDVNELLLSDIAALTNGKYYHSPDSDQLGEIYDAISDNLCETGSISGCVYNDENNDAATNGIDANEPTLDNWEIILDNSGATTSQLTVDGCYSFSGLLDGDYIVSEVLTGDWVQTFPVESVYNISISNYNSATQKDFANYLASLTTCGDGAMQTPNSSGFYEECDDGNLVDGDGCSSACTLENTGGGTFCGDGIVQDPNTAGQTEQCDDGNTVSGDGCSSSCILENTGSSGSSSSGGGGGGSFCGDGKIQLPNSAGEYEECDGSVGLPIGKTCSAECVIIDLITPSSTSAPSQTDPADNVVVLGEEGAPVLEVKKTATPNKAKPGDEVEFIVVVKNTGNLTAFITKLTDELPDGLVYSEGGGTFKAWDLGDINPGESVETKFKVKISATAKNGILSNLAKAVATNHDEVVATADLMIEDVEVLAASGFNQIEFIYLLMLLAVLIGSSQMLRKRELPV